MPCSRERDNLALVASDSETPETPAEVELRALAEQQDWRALTTRALQTYGAELLAYLHAVARDPDLATEAFAELGEDLWRGIASFRWGASLRTWLYTLARNALNQLRRQPRRRADRNLPLSSAPELEVVVRTMTNQFQRTDVKDKFRVLYDELDPEEHELLLLRLDRELSWKEIARILGGDSELDTRAAALRKRFERTRERLKKLAIDRGLV